MRAELPPFPYEIPRRKHKTADERFWGRVDKTPTCWLWQGAPMPNGYGKFFLGGKIKAVHRLSWEAENGPVPEGMVIDHKCHQKLCVNPDHLQAVTNSQNGQNRKGASVRSKSGVRNVYWDGRSWRVQIAVRRRRFNAGPFDTIEEAAAAASELRRKHMTNSLADMVGEGTPYSRVAV
jgi:hypothetical protein